MTSVLHVLSICQILNNIAFFANALKRRSTSAIQNFFLTCPLPQTRTRLIFEIFPVAISSFSSTAFSMLWCLEPSWVKMRFAHSLPALAQALQLHIQDLWTPSKFYYQPPPPVSLYSYEQLTLKTCTSNLSEIIAPYPLPHFPLFTLTFLLSPLFAAPQPLSLLHLKPNRSTAHTLILLWH